MMLQNLPNTVILNIVSYVGKVSRIDISIVESVYNTMDSIQASNFVLAHICQKWRFIVLGVIYHRFELQEALMPFVFSNRSIMFMEIDSDGISDHSFAYIRNLTLYVNFFDILHGQQIDKLASRMPENSYFPSANTVVIYINTHSQTTTNLCIREENILEFAKYIWKLAPSCKQIEVLIVSNTIELQDYHLLGKIITILCKDTLVTSLYLSLDFLFLTDTIIIVPNLSQLHIKLEKSNGCYRLMHLSSNSLQKLHVYEVQKHEYLEKLFLDDNNSPVTYPFLLHLCISLTTKDDQESCQCFANVVPFPRLQAISMRGAYPFSDDILFRGNCKTLKSLVCNLDYQTALMLNSKDGFKNKRFKYLEKVNIDSFIDTIDDGPKVVDEYIRFIRNIGNDLKELHIKDSDIAYQLVKHLPKQQNSFTNIRWLSLKNSNIIFPELVEILKNLPHIQRLTSCLEEYEPISGAVYNLEFLDHFYKKYHGVFRYFSLWEIHTDNGVSIEYSVLYAIILAIICPRFIGIYMLKVNGNNFRFLYLDNIKQKVNEQPFAKYSHLIKKLLPTERNTSHDSTLK